MGFEMLKYVPMKHKHHWVGKLTHLCPRLVDIPQTWLWWCPHVCCLVRIESKKDISPKPTKMPLQLERTKT